MFPLRLGYIALLLSVLRITWCLPVRAPTQRRIDRSAFDPHLNPLRIPQRTLLIKYSYTLPL